MPPPVWALTPGVQGHDDPSVDVVTFPCLSVAPRKPYSLPWF